RYDPPPSHQSRKASDTLTENRGADLRVNPIRSDQTVSYEFASVHKRQMHLAVRLSAPCKLLTEPQPIRRERPHRSRDNREQIRTEHRDVGKSIKFDRLVAEVEELPGSSRVP